MRESTQHLTPAQVRKRELFTRQIQLNTQDDCAGHTLAQCIYSDTLPVGSVERAIVEQFVAVAESGELRRGAA